MSIDTTRIGLLAADLMADVEREHPDAHLEDVLLVAEISYEQDGETVTNGRYRCTSHRASVALGMAELTADQIRKPIGGDDA